jgi:uncharacterized protein YuzE
MAEISISDLIRIIQEHPDYFTKWENGVSADKALYIKFHNSSNTQLDSQTFETADGSELVIDINSDGVAYGIEIA